MLWIILLGACADEQRTLACRDLGAPDISVTSVTPDGEVAVGASAVVSGWIRHPDSLPSTVYIDTAAGSAPAAAAVDQAAGTWTATLSSSWLQQRADPSGDVALVVTATDACGEQAQALGDVRVVRDASISSLSLSVGSGDYLALNRSTLVTIEAGADAAGAVVTLSGGTDGLTFPASATLQQNTAGTAAVAAVTLAGKSEGDWALQASDGDTLWAAAVVTVADGPRLWPEGLGLLAGSSDTLYLDPLGDSETHCSAALSDPSLSSIDVDVGEDSLLGGGVTISGASAPSELTISADAALGVGTDVTVTVTCWDTFGVSSEETVTVSPSPDWSDATVEIALPAGAPYLPADGSSVTLATIDASASAVGQSVTLEALAPLVLGEEGDTVVLRQDGDRARASALVQGSGEGEGAITAVADGTVVAWDSADFVGAPTFTPGTRTLGAGETYTAALDTSGAAVDCWLEGSTSGLASLTLDGADLLDAVIVDTVPASGVIAIAVDDPLAGASSAKVVCEDPFGQQGELSIALATE